MGDKARGRVGLVSSSSTALLRLPVCAGLGRIPFSFPEQVVSWPEALTGWRLTEVAGDTWRCRWLLSLLPLVLQFYGAGLGDFAPRCRNVPKVICRVSWGSCGWSGPVAGRPPPCLWRLVCEAVRRVAHVLRRSCFRPFGGGRVKPRLLAEAGAVSLLSVLDVVWDPWSGVGMAMAYS